MVAFLSVCEVTIEYADDTNDDDDEDDDDDAAYDDVVLMQVAVRSAVQTVAACSMTGDVTGTTTVLTTAMK